ncbi:MAG: hypothetical protein P8Y47_08045 [Alphaproteobacteria bacterium]
MSDKDVNEILANLQQRMNAIEALSHDIRTVCDKNKRAINLGDKATRLGELVADLRASIRALNNTISD